MESNETLLHPELVMCPSCDVELELDQAESDSQKFTCPACGAEVEITDPPISKELRHMIKHGKIRVSVWDRIDFWFLPILTCSFGCLMLVRSWNESFSSLIWLIVFLGLGIFLVYRAIISDKLTFIPSIDPITKKIAIVRTLQDKYRWDLYRRRNGYFIFEERTLGGNPRVIKIICARDGYYLNCMVNHWKGHKGVSIFDTKNIVKSINELSGTSV
jgi:predicted RNA-binding Zn-ribbon protein involved in translation (DUF1610 family)